MTEQTLEERRLYWQRRKQEIVESKRSAALKTLSAHGVSIFTFNSEILKYLASDYFMHTQTLSEMKLAKNCFCKHIT